MKNKKYPTDGQIKYILGLVSMIDMYIKLIENPKQKPKDFKLRDIAIKEDFYKEILNNNDTQKLIQTLIDIGITTKWLYYSSRDREIKSFKHIFTVESFVKGQSDSVGSLKSFKSNYILLYKYFDLVTYEALEDIILSNLRYK